MRWRFCWVTWPTTRIGSSWRIPSDRVAVVDVVANLDHALIEPAGEWRHQPGVREVDLDPGQPGPGRLQARFGRGPCALGLKAPGGELPRRVELHLPLPDQRPGFTPARLQVARVQAHDLVALVDP